MLDFLSAGHCVFRWLTNRLVKEGKVLYLDLDPGQREFGLPGYLSLSLISHPLLGILTINQSTFTM